ncbi:hypothetical protein E2C01_063889 [Portunus trituberculatus]|uniref:Uncharacterized protein n=1 Tax=Portunus trituberculatus TaxID=210409 RepID=A0A5B7HIV8_PORTR|nr:hypothetical protein [Portunus trituberculatus]
MLTLATASPVKLLTTWALLIPFLSSSVTSGVLTLKELYMVLSLCSATSGKTRHFHKMNGPASSMF